MTLSRHSRPSRASSRVGHACPSPSAQSFGPSAKMTRSPSVGSAEGVALLTEVRRRVYRSRAQADGAICPSRLRNGGAGGSDALGTHECTLARRVCLWRKIRSGLRTRLGRKGSNGPGGGLHGSHRAAMWFPWLCARGSRRAVTRPGTQVERLCDACLHHVPHMGPLQDFALAVAQGQQMGKSGCPVAFRARPVRERMPCMVWGGDPADASLIRSDLGGRLARLEAGRSVQQE